MRLWMKRSERPPEYLEMIAERQRVRDRIKARRRKEKRRAAKLAASPIIAISKTDPVTRRRLYAPIGEMSKNALREMIAQAVRNTAEMATC